MSLAPPDMPVVPAFEPFSALKYRNQSLDAVFYDVSSLTLGEVDQARAMHFAEGRILSVGPETGSGVRDLGQAQDALQRKDDLPRHLAVAGVGSSAVGTAAFARNVAQAVEAPVAAVVSGYGMRDLLSEALGGWFWFRALNKMRHAAEDFVQTVSPTNHPFEGTGLNGSDTETLRQLFSADEPLFDTVTGHSKGNLSIAEGLFRALERSEKSASALLAQARIITIGAAIYMPDQAKTVVDVMGRLDNFGLFNSHTDVEIDLSIPWAWHHTNTNMLWSLDVTDAVKQALRFDARRS